MVYAMGGIELKDGSNQERHHPFVVDILEEGELRESEDVALAGEHEYGADQEEQVAEQHDAAQATDGDAGAVIALKHLHGGEAYGAQGVDIRSQAPLEQAGASTYDHQQGSCEEDGGLQSIQLSHGWNLVREC